MIHDSALCDHDSVRFSNTVEEKRKGICQSTPHRERARSVVEHLDAVNARRGIEMIVVVLVMALRIVLGRFLQVKFKSVQNTDRVEPFPCLTEREANLLVVRDRALKVVDKELWSERCHTRLHRAHRSLGPFFSRLANRILSAVSPRVKMSIDLLPHVKIYSNADSLPHIKIYSKQICS